jgi:hypothetical protein
MQAELSATGASAATAAFDSNVKSGMSVGDAAKAAVEVGAGAAAAAGCVATGVGAPLAPLCGIVGGKIGGWLADHAGPIIKSLGHFISNLFGGKETPYCLKNPCNCRVCPADSVPDPNGAGGLYIQTLIADCVLAKQLGSTIEGLISSIQALGGSPDASTILKRLATVHGLSLVSISGRTWFQCLDQQGQWSELTWDYPMIPPSIHDGGTQVMTRYAKGQINNEQAAAQLRYVLALASAWSDALALAATREMVIVATDAVVDLAYNLPPQPGTRAAPDANAALAALTPTQQRQLMVYAVAVDQLKRGIYKGVSFMLRSV